VFFSTHCEIIFIECFLSRTGNSKSIFSSLLLANYEAHMQIGSYENFSSTFEVSKHCDTEGVYKNQKNRIDGTLAMSEIEEIGQKQIDNKSESSDSDEHMMKLETNVSCFCQFFRINY